MSYTEEEMCYQCQCYVYDCECLQMSESKALTRIWTVDEIFSNLMGDARDLEQTLNLSLDEVMALLETHKWNQENLLNQYYEAEEEEKRVSRKKGLLQKRTMQLGVNSSETDCRVCLEPVSDFIVMSDCGHRSCPSCFSQYLESCLASRN